MRSPFKIELSYIITNDYCGLSRVTTPAVLGKRAYWMKMVSSSLRKLYSRLQQDEIATTILMAIVTSGDVLQAGIL
jgi:hypothetical protein